MDTEPLWLVLARRYVGVRETPGPATTPLIRRWLIRLRAWWTDDETPWCGTFCATVMRDASIEPPRAWYRARAWLDWGMPLDTPALGCIVVYAREGGGHVGIVAGLDKRGRILTLGGNQGNQVSIAPFDRARVLGFRWPLGYPLTTGAVPIIDTETQSSTGER